MATLGLELSERVGRSPSKNSLTPKKLTETVFGDGVASPAQAMTASIFPLLFLRTWETASCLPVTVLKSAFTSELWISTPITSFPRS